MGNRCADHATPIYPQKLALTSPTGGGRSVGIVRLRTKATEFFIYSSKLEIVSVLHILPRNKCNIRNSFCYFFVSFTQLLMSPIQVSRANIRVSFATVPFLHLGYIMMEPSHCVGHGWLPYFPEKNPVGIAGNGIAITCCTPGHRMEKVAPL